MRANLFFILIFGLILIASCDQNRKPFIKEALESFSSEVSSEVFSNFLDKRDIVNSVYVISLLPNSIEDIGYCGLFLELDSVNVKKIFQMEKLSKSISSECYRVVNSKQTCKGNSYPIPDLDKNGPLYNLQIINDNWEAYTLNFKNGMFLNDSRIMKSAGAINHGFTNGYMVDVDSDKILAFILIW